jgi:hypothetical protein
MIISSAGISKLRALSIDDLTVASELKAVITTEYNGVDAIGLKVYSR